MKKNVEIRLQNLFPRLRGVDFGFFHKFGTRNALSLIRELYNNPAFKGDKFHLEIEDCEFQLSKTDRDDTLRILELGARMGYFRLCQDNFKFLESSLKSQLNQAKKDPRFAYAPVFPVLRNSACFKPGDDVMVFTGKSDLDVMHDKLHFISPFKWVTATAITWADDTSKDNVFVYTRQPVFDSGINGDGHEANYSKASPFILGRQEFFCLRELIQNEYGWDFVLNFLNNCYRHDDLSNLIPYESLHFDQLRKIFLDPDVEMISNNELKTKERDWFLKILCRLQHLDQSNIFYGFKKAIEEKGHTFLNEEFI